jgi:NitT/TauT family transport system substrate-binding protein
MLRSSSERGFTAGGEAMRRSDLWAAVAACFVLAAGAARAEDKIRILCPTWSGFAPVFVAQDLGYFDKLGITVDIRFEDERPNVMAAMARGDIEMDMRTVGEYQGRPRDETTPGVIIGTIDQSTGGDGVVAEGAIVTSADLKGKVLASEPNIPGRLLLQLDLKKHGLSLSDLSIKEISTADTVPVFADPSIAAVATFQPFLSQTLDKLGQRKPHVLVSSSDYPGIVTDVIIVRQDDLKAHPDKYRKFLAGIYRAVRYFDSDHADFIKRAAPHFNLSPVEFEESIKGSLAYTSYTMAKTALGVPGAPGTMYQTFDTVMQLNLENGAADHTLAPDRSIDNSVIASLAPADLGE